MTMGEAEPEDDHFADNPFGMDDIESDSKNEITNGGSKIIGGAVNPTAVTFTAEKLNDMLRVKQQEEPEEESDDL